MTKTTLQVLFFVVQRGNRVIIYKQLNKENMKRENGSIANVRAANSNFAPYVKAGAADRKNIVDIVANNDGDDIVMCLNLGGFVEAIRQGIIKECKPFDEKTADLCSHMGHLSVDGMTLLEMVKIASKMVGYLEDKSFGLLLWGAWATLVFERNGETISLSSLNFDDILLFDCGTFRFEQNATGETILFVKIGEREEIRWCGRYPDAVLADVIISQNPAFAIFVAN